MTLETFVVPLPIILPLIGVIDIGPLVAAVAIFCAVQFVCYLVLKILIVRIENYATRHSLEVAEIVTGALRAIHPVSYGIVSVTLALFVFTLPTWLYQVLYVVTWVVVLWQAIRIAVVVVGYGVQRALASESDVDESPVDQNAITAAALITLLLRIVLWSFGGLFILSNIGVEVTSLIAGLGIGGIAVAFALQGILSDLFSSLSIYIDKPFRIGDFIVIGDEAGTVEKIGIKTTRIRTLQGEELVMSNAELTTAHIHNFKKMQERRVTMTFGVIYETPVEVLKTIPGMVKELFADIPDTRFDRVYFTRLADFALEFEVVYHIDSRDIEMFLKAQEAFHFALLERFATAGIEFAYPTQVHYKK